MCLVNLWESSAGCVCRLVYYFCIPLLYSSLNTLYLCTEVGGVVPLGDALGLGEDADRGAGVGELLERHWL